MRRRAFSTCGFSPRLAPCHMSSSCPSPCFSDALLLPEGTARPSLSVVADCVVDESFPCELWTDVASPTRNRRSRYRKHPLPSRTPPLNYSIAAGARLSVASALDRTAAASSSSFGVLHRLTGMRNTKASTILGVKNTTAQK